MSITLTDIDWLSVVIAAVVSCALAGVWFGVVIARPYVVVLGRQDAPEVEGSLVRNVGPVVCLAVTTITSAVLVQALDLTSIGDAVVFGLVVGIGYLTAMTFQIAINPSFPRPLAYGALNAPFFVATSLTTSVILVAMR